MSAEFDDAIKAVSDLKEQVADPASFTMAEREVLELVLEGLLDRNRKMLRSGRRSTSR